MSTLEYQTDPQLKHLATEIAYDLNRLDKERAWHAEDYYQFVVRLVSDQGHQISIAAEDRIRFELGGKLEVYGAYPTKNNEPYGSAQVISSYDHPPKIGMSSGREPRDLAKDIVRRFLPKFLAMWDEAQQRLEDHYAFVDKTKSMRQRMLRAFKGTQLDEHDIEHVQVYRSLQDQAWGDIRISAHDGTVALDLHHVPLDVAEQIGRMLAPEPKQDAPPDECPICTGRLNVDTEYMLKKFGIAFTEMPWRDWSFYCEDCDEAGLWDEFVQIAKKVAEDAQSSVEFLSDEDYAGTQETSIAAQQGWRETPWQ